jgi:uncharacterized SAM-binding protein YcdF (DUF218 family)
VSDGGLPGILRRIGYGALAINALGGAVALALYRVVRHGERETLHAPADAIVVLGAEVQPSGRPSAALRGRVRRAVALYHDGYAPRVVMTGGVGESGIAEATVMQALAVAHGVPEGAIVLEPHATRTVESARAVGALARAAGWRSVIVVSDPFHLRRTALLFAAEGLAVQTAGTDDYYFTRRFRRFYRGREVAALVAQTLMGEIPLRAWRQVRRTTDDD